MLRSSERNWAFFSSERAASNLEYAVLLGLVVVVAPIGTIRDTFVKG
jgi:Flp pilus assembly pilin Flp